MSQLSYQQVKPLVGSDIPAPRFGHSLTLVSKNKAVLFGGAIGDSGKFIITNESYLFDFDLKRWKKLECTGDIPSQRAAHASCMLDPMTMVIYGGAASGGGGLSSDEIYLLDLKAYDNPGMLKPTASYVKLPTIGQTPGKRYGHTMIYQKPFLIVFGGNTGAVPVNDVWVLNPEKSPRQWQKQCITSQDSPAVRVYHSAALCKTGSANGMMVIFGGRTQDQSSLNDTWGLRRHRNGMWDWVLAPYKQNSSVLPICRYQHRVDFIGPLMIVVGGRTNGADEQGKCVEVYDTETSDWYRVNSFNRYRHSTVVIDNTMYVHGGFEPEFANKPLDSMIQIELTNLASFFPKLGKYLGVKEYTNILGERNQVDPPPNAIALQQQQQLNTQTFQKKSIGNQNQNYAQQQPIQQQTFSKSSAVGAVMSQNNNNYSNNQNLDISMNAMNKIPVGKVNNAQRSYTPIKSQKNGKEIRLSNQVIVATTQDTESNEFYNNNNPTYGNYIQQQNQNPKFGNFKRINIIDLPEESRKLVGGNIADHSMMLVSPIDEKAQSLAEMFIATLLKKPEDWKHTELRLPFKKELILRLCDEVTMILLDEPSLLRLSVPLKIFGSLNGRFGDLLRLFNNFGFPVDEEGGDMEKFDYLFLGNYVDRGFNSLETVILLFALKLKYPDQLHLIRGAHDERRVNRLFGFAEECALRLGEDINDPNSVYQKVNKAFDALPLAALLEEEIFCLHGGLGPNVNHVNDIVDIHRPVSPFSNPIVYDILYTDYVENDPLPVSENKSKDYFNLNNTFKFSDFKVDRFLQETGINMIIRSKECTFDGYQRSRSGAVTTITSCTDYMGKYGNQACLIKIKKNFQIEPNLIPRAPYRNGTWLTPENPLKTPVFFTEEEQKIRRRLASPLLKQY